MIKSKFEKEWKKLKNNILSRTHFTENSEEAKANRREKSKNDILYFAKTYFPEYYRFEMAKFHHDWVSIREKRKEISLVEAFRGSGKSTFFTFIDVIYDICFNQSRFTVIGSYIVDKAKLFTTRLLAEFSFNQGLINDFGAFIDGRQSIKNFKVKIPFTNDFACVMAVSIGQDPRGFVFGAYRPDKIRLDDIQSDKRAKSKKFVKQSIEWIKLALIPALVEDYSLIVVATPLNSNCVASNLAKDENVNTFKFPALNRGRSQWPSVFPIERLKKLKKTMGSLFFAQEFMLVPIPLDEQKFRAEWIKYYSKEEIEGRLFDAVISWTDSSLTAKGDYKAIVCLGLIGGIIYVLKSRVRKESVTRMINAMYEIYNLYNPIYMYYEDYTDKDNLSILAESFQNAAEDKGLYLPIKAERNAINKELRIEGTLSSLIENGIIRFLKDDPDQQLIIEQILEFPDGEYDDGIDALEGACRKILEFYKRVHGKITTRKVNRTSKTLEGY